MSTDSEEQLNSYAAQKTYYTQKISENPDWEMAGVLKANGIGVIFEKENITMVKAAETWPPYVSGWTN